MSDTEVNPKIQQAIDAALSKNWQSALQLNKNINKESPEDTETLNRLARTYLELGEVDKAKTHYRKVLKIDSYNTIAEKNLSKLSNLNSNNLKKTPDNQQTIKVEPDTFLEEPGKSKVLILHDLALPTILASLKTGDTVKLEPQKKDVVVFSQEGKRLGKIEPELATDFGTALKAGSAFLSLVKSVLVDDSTSQYSVTIFVKETFKSPKVSKNIFPSNSKRFTPYAKEESLNVLSSEKSTNKDTSGEEGLSEEAEQNIDTTNLPKFTSFEKMAAKEVEEDQNLEDN